MNQLKLEDKSYTVKEYLSMLKDSLHKLEYEGGDIQLMAGGSTAHNSIVDNTFVALRNGKSGCTVKSSETAISIRELNKYYFPDISATCDEPKFESGGPSRLINPNLLIEVLSKGTEKRDRGVKFNAYKKLPSFREYILIDSKDHLVETYYREQKGLWRIGNYYQLNQEVEIVTLGVSIPMSVIYDGVELDNGQN